MTNEPPKAENQSIPENVMNEPNHQINESADKIRLKTKIKRGTETRDQDEIEVVIKGDDPTEAVEKLNATLEQLQETAQIARKTQPGENE